MATVEIETVAASESLNCNKLPHFTSPGLVIMRFTMLYSICGCLNICTTGGARFLTVAVTFFGLHLGLFKSAT